VSESARPSPKEGGGRREEQGARSKEKKRRPLDSNGTSSADRFMRAPKTRADSLNHVDAFERHDLRRSGRALPEIRSETKFYTISLVIASCTINPWLDRSITNLHTAIWELAIGMATPGSSRVEPLTHPCPNPTVMVPPFASGVVRKWVHPPEDAARTLHPMTTSVSTSPARSQGGARSRSHRGAKRTVLYCSALFVSVHSRGCGTLLLT
jgi:hypothetical protein